MVAILVLGCASGAKSSNPAVDVLGEVRPGGRVETRLPRRIERGARAAALAVRGQVDRHTSQRAPEGTSCIAAAVTNTSNPAVRRLSEMGTVEAATVPARRNRRRCRRQ